MNEIHPTAVISPAAKLGENITVGPFAIIDENVEIGDNCFIGPHATIYDGARIGNNVKIYQGASVSNLPQDLKFKDGDTLFYIGDNTTIREFATLHKGTDDKGFSKIGSNCLLMAYTHIAHDCIVGDNSILANGVQVGGHAEIGDWVTIGGMTPVHQFVKIGSHAMIGGGFRTVFDIPPYVLVAGEPLKYTGVNTIGLRRRGFSNDEIMTLKNAYSIIYRSGLNLTPAKEKLKADYEGHPLVQNILDFFETVTRAGLRG